jgi:glycosyltransferase involved in cell wall biosynthesis
LGITDHPPGNPEGLKGFLKRIDEMKILLLAPSPFFQLRGTPIAVRLLTKVLTEAGHQVHILNYHEGETVEFPNLTISRIPALPGIKNIKPGPSWKKIVSDLAMFVKLLKMMRKNRFDILHAVEESVFMALVIKKIYGIPFVYDLDSSLSQQLSEKYKTLRFLKPILEFFEKMAIRGSLGTITVCKALEDNVVKWDPEKLVVRLEDITLLPERSGQGSQFENQEINEPVVMYIGNLESYQGIDLLLESFQIAAHKIPEARLVIIGGADPDIRRYRKKAEELEVGDKTRFLGPKPIDQMRSFFDQAQILVSPRIQGQNTPMKIYSYLDSGKALLATNLPTHTQVLDNQIALLVSPTPEAMAQGMVTLMQDSGLRDTLACQAKGRVQQEYCFEAFQKKLIIFYSIIASKMRNFKEGTL